MALRPGVLLQVVAELVDADVIMQPVVPAGLGPATLRLVPPTSSSNSTHGTPRPSTGLAGAKVRDHLDVRDTGCPAEQLPELGAQEAAAHWIAEMGRVELSNSVKEAMEPTNAWLVLNGVGSPIDAAG